MKQLPHRKRYREDNALIVEDDTCPDCKGKCQDKHGFDCVRCAGEGVVDE